MHRLGGGPEGGGWLVDTPGMRELQMSEVASGVAEVFDDIVAMTLECRFSNCTHADEPACAIRSGDRARGRRTCPPCKVAQADRRGRPEHRECRNPARSLRQGPQEAMSGG